MAGGFFHIGTFLIFAAWVLFVFVSVSSPVWDTLAFLKINYNGQTLALGNWGYCYLRTTGHVCSDKSVGYQLGRIVTDFNKTHFSSALDTALHNLSRALILHPIAAGVAFISWLTALGAHRIGFLFSSLIAFVAFVIGLVALALDFAMFDIVRDHVNDSNGPGSGAHFSVAIWLVLAAEACLLLGSITVCCGCFTDRRRRAREDYY